MYYLIALHHTEPKDEYMTLWKANNAGYCQSLNLAGLYETIDKGYHDSENTLPVDSSILEDLVVYIKNNDGTKRPVILNHKSVWNELGIIKVKNELQRKIIEFKTKEERVAIVNEIILLLSQVSRRFFYDKDSDRVAELFFINNRLYYKREWIYQGKTEISLATVQSKKPKLWYHGGTLLDLIREFKYFIDSGKQLNPLYSGLQGTHWGYSEIDLIKINNKAIELGYFGE